MSCVLYFHLDVHLKYRLTHLVETLRNILANREITSAQSALFVQKHILFILAHGIECWVSPVIGIILSRFLFQKWLLKSLRVWKLRILIGAHLKPIWPNFIVCSLHNYAWSLTSSPLNLVTHRMKFSDSTIIQSIALDTCFHSRTRNVCCKERLSVFSQLTWNILRWNRVVSMHFTLSNKMIRFC